MPLPNSQANYLAMAALPTYVLQASNDGSLGSCSPSGPGQVTQVLAACSQVRVAGRHRATEPSGCGLSLQLTTLPTCMPA